MRTSIATITALGLLGCAAAGTSAPASTLDRVKSLCRDYITGYLSPATGLAYGKRINGPTGISVLESPSEIAQRRVGGEPRPWGYGSGIEDLAYQNGMFLYALLDAEHTTRDSYLAQTAEQVFRGLQSMSRLSPVPGFVPRGPHPDGKSYYPDSSLDQHSLYMCALWRWYHSRFATAADKTWIRDMAAKVMRRLEKDGWSIQNEDSSKPSHAGGTMLNMDPVTSLLLLQMLAVTHDLTGDPHWKEAFDRFGLEDNGRRWKLLDRPVDPERAFRHTMFINQDMLRAETLRRIVREPERRAILLRRLDNFATDMIACNYFQAWRRVDWLGDEGWPDAKQPEVADRYLQPLGLNTGSRRTVLELVRMYDPARLSPPALHGRRNRYEPMLIATPAMVFQIALMSRNPEHVKTAAAGVHDMLTRTAFDRVDLGWAYNYTVLAALWSLAGLP
ncbi:MAG: hypothetical protein JNL98_09445 [Bryobacterales bacterium]|nr:hypothetical protein [Bryobacterales bacterium]